MARIANKQNRARLVEPWRSWVAEIPEDFTVTDVARQAGLDPSNVQKIMDGRNKKPERDTERKLDAAIRTLRDRCPHCLRLGLEQARKDASVEMQEAFVAALKEVLEEEQRELHRRIEERKAARTPTGEDPGVDIPDPHSA